MGLGLIMHIIAKVIFVLVGYGIHMYLGKSLTPAIYGSIGVIMSIININYNFLSNGARQAASHLIASNCYNNHDLIKKSYFYQMIIACTLAFINFCFANLSAEILNHPELANYIRIAAAIIPFTALYFISVGILNGFRLLVYEAITVSLYPLARLSIIPFVAFVFHDSVLGTIAGFFIAALIGCIIGNLYIIKKANVLNDTKPKVSNKEYGKQIIDFLAFFLCITAILNLDMLFVNALVLDVNAVGYYTGATNFSKVSYYLLSAIYLVALPTITRQYNDGKNKECQKTINLLLILIINFVLPIVMIASPIIANLMDVFYTSEYRNASIPTAILMFSQFFLGIFVVLNILVCSTTNKRFSTILGTVVVLVDSILCALLIPYLSIAGASIASLLSNIFGVLIVSKKVFKIYGKVWSKNLTKSLLANITIFTVMLILNQIWTSNNFFIVVGICSCTYILFIVILVILNIIPLKDILKII